MGGGLLQLIAVGQFDSYLTANPDLSFYQYVYKRHTNFAMESRNLMFTRNPVLAPRGLVGTFECQILRYGDLLSNLYFCFTLPDIYSSEKYKFRWVKNVGAAFIKKASIYIDGMMIDQTTGEWMNIWNELTMPVGDNNYNQMVGNVPELQDPKSNFTRISIKNNRFIYFYYPESSKFTNAPPSIASRRILVPLNFWFTKNPALSLPLLRLQFKIITVKLELVPSEQLYQVYSDKLNMFVSPLFYNELHDDSINIYTFTKDINLEPYIEANYIFLDEQERNSIFIKPRLTYLVEQLTITSKQSSVVNENVNILVNNPTKEIIWVIKRNDLWKYNETLNYSMNIPESKEGALHKATIRFNNNVRLEEKDSEYFSMIQPYQHHTKIPRAGIYCYSFALYPEKEYLSGYYNAALVKTNLNLQLKNSDTNMNINKALGKIGKQSYQVSYIIDVYSINYNLFEVIGSEAGLKFTVST